MIENLPIPKIPQIQIYNIFGDMSVWHIMRYTLDKLDEPPLAHRLAIHLQNGSRDIPLYTEKLASPRMFGGCARSVIKRETMICAKNASAQPKSQKLNLAKLIFLLIMFTQSNLRQYLCSRKKSTTSRLKPACTSSAKRKQKSAIRAKANKPSPCSSVTMWRCYITTEYRLLVRVTKMCTASSRQIFLLAFGVR